MTALPALSRVADIIAEVAAEAIMPRFGRLAAHEISAKEGPSDLVTIADQEAERLLHRRLAPLLPGAVFVGEEASAADPDLLRRLEGEDLAWLVDPIDGTLNFAAGLPLFGVMVAVVKAGEILAAWIHDPVRGRMASAERGQGAELDGRRIRLTPPRDPAAMHVTLSFRASSPDMRRQFGERANQFGSLLILRCAAQEYLALLEGASHACLYNRTYPWDHAAGALAATEAGGAARRIDGAPYRPRAPYMDAPMLVAASDETWALVKAKIFE